MTCGTGWGMGSLGTLGTECSDPMLSEACCSLDPSIPEVLSVGSSTRLHWAVAFDKQGPNKLPCPSWRGPQGCLFHGHQGSPALMSREWNGQDSEAE